MQFTTRSGKLVAGALAVMIAVGWGSSLAAADDPASDTPAETSSRLVERAISFLSSAQAEDGSFSAEAGPAVTALVATGLLRNGRSVSDPLVARSLAYVEKFVQPDGGIYNGANSLYKNYETCTAILCLSEANRDGRYDSVLEGAEAYVKGLQWDGSEGHDESSFNYGGAGYGNKKRPDLSNTNFLLDALKATGNGPEDEAVKKALLFVSRCQNLETEHNTTPFAALVNDGGFYYTAANNGESQAGKEDNGGLRSYASMTYAGLKSMIFAGVGPDDPRVQAAVTWLGKHYDLESNPGMGTSGLYYYYHTFAKALDALGQDKFTDADATEHDWRAELVAALASRQRDNGSWANENERWLEGGANLVTGYALMALAYCRPAGE
jgi:squalene-hopene/tetraprenyl-beta-curcumene cyclase